MTRRVMAASYAPCHAGGEEAEGGEEAAWRKNQPDLGDISLGTSQLTGKTLVKSL